MKIVAVNDTRNTTTDNLDAVSVALTSICPSVRLQDAAVPAAVHEEVATVQRGVEAADGDPGGTAGRHAGGVHAIIRELRAGVPRQCLPALRNQTGTPMWRCVGWALGKGDGQGGRERIRCADREKDAVGVSRRSRVLACCGG